MNSPDIMPFRQLLSLVSLTIIAVIVTSCTLVAAPEPTESAGLAPTNTVPPTRTPVGAINLPTSLPTLTSVPITQPGGGTVPTAIVANPPTAVPPVVSQNTPLPISIVILSPVPGNIVSGTVQVLGAASHPQFLQYQLEYGPDPNPGNLWFPATGVSQSPVFSGLLGLWNTTTINDDRYQLRLRVTLTDGTILATVVNNIRVQNQQPTPVPTATTLPRPIAAFTQNTTSGRVPLVVNFTNQSSGQITGYTWNFGDGGSSTEINPTHTFRNPGVYTVLLTARGPGGSSNVSRQISVQSPTAPVAAFGQNRVSGESPLVVQFRDQSTGNITSREWRFGDGTTSSAREPEHTFTEVGTYNVILSVSGPGGSSSVRRQITVENPNVPPPDAAFSASATSGEAPLTVDFTSDSNDNVSTYDWRIDDETISNNAEVDFTFTQPGDYLVQLVVTGDGGQDTAQQTINVTAPPDAPDVNIAAAPEDGDIPLQVAFSTTVNSGEVTSYTWDFGDGNTGSGANTSHTYTEVGTYTVALTAEGPGGTDTETLTVSATEALAPPQADFDFVLDENDLNDLTVNFTNLSSGDELTYAWDFGDGTTSSNPAPQHVYSSYGTYTVQLTVSNPTGDDTAAAEITLTEPLQSVQAVVSAAPTNTQPNVMIQFDSSGSTGDIATYAWDFGDGTTSDQPNPTHMYAQTGTFTATLALTGQDGSSSMDTIDIVVADALQAVFTANPNPAAVNQPIEFDSSPSTGVIVSYSWDFGDGTTSDQAKPMHTYAAGGEYTVRLVVSDGATQSEASNVVSVAAPLQAVFTANPNPAAVNQPIEFDASDSSGNIATFAWDFGNGLTSNEPAPMVPYQQGGDYTVTLTLTSIGGQTSETTQTVTVNDAPPPPANPAIVFVSEREGNRQIFLMDADGNNVIRLTDTGGRAEFPSWSVNNEIVYSQDEQLTLIGVDGSNVRSVSADGGATSVAGIQPVWSPDGARIAFATEQNGNRDIYVIDANGANLTQLTTDPADDQHPSWSPDGNQLAFTSNRDGQNEIYTYDVNSGALTRITENDASDVQPSWSRNGTQIAFTSDRNDNNQEIYVMDANGDNVNRLTNSPDADTQPSWSADNNQIVFVSQRDGGDREIYVMDANGSNPTRLTDAPGQDVQPTFKPTP